MGGFESFIQFPIGCSNLACFSLNRSRRVVANLTIWDVTLEVDSGSDAGNHGQRPPCMDRLKYLMAEPCRLDSRSMTYTDSAHRKGRAPPEFQNDGTFVNESGSHLYAYGNSILDGIPATFNVPG